MVPGGRTPPACYDLKTGSRLHWQWAQKGSRTCEVAAYDQWYFASGALHQIADGKIVMPAVSTVHDSSGFYSLSSNEIIADGFQFDDQSIQETDGKKQGSIVGRRVVKNFWKVPMEEDYGRLLLKAGGRFYAGKEGRLTALDVDPVAGKATISWRQSIKGDPWTMLAADDKLFVVTVAGDIYCFGGKQAEPHTYNQPTRTQAAPPLDPWDARPETPSKRPEPAKATPWF